MDENDFLQISINPTSPKQKALLGTSYVGYIIFHALFSKRGVFVAITFSIKGSNMKRWKAGRKLLKPREVPAECSVIDYILWLSVLDSSQ